jgi:hypothetical protein
MTSVILVLRDMPILLNPPHDAAFAEKAAVFRPSSKMRQRVKARLFGTCQPAVNAGQAIKSLAEGGHGFSGASSGASATSRSTGAIPATRSQPS